jgi:hypothetical protein
MYDFLIHYCKLPSGFAQEQAHAQTQCLEKSHMENILLCCNNSLKGLCRFYALQELVKSTAGHMLTIVVLTLKQILRRHVSHLAIRSLSNTIIGNAEPNVSRGYCWL